MLVTIVLTKAQSSNIVQASINGYKLDLEVAGSPTELSRGLGGRTSLSTDKGMLFIFSDNAKHCMWMKDMKFAIDIMWLDDNRRVIETKNDVKPETYPEAFCNTDPARYVIELKSGTLAKYTIYKDTVVSF